MAAYTRLGWPHTTPDPAGAEPGGGDGTSASGCRVVTDCSGADFVRLPYAAGSDALVRLERVVGAVGIVPAMRVDRHRIVLVVRAGSAPELAGLPGVEVLSGPDTRVLLPPSPGIVWDTPPWNPDGTPRPLPGAGVLVHELRRSLSLYARGGRDA
ncbi:hypothetical protein [Streptomyces subrutilus]|uniref:hypothetical protein n=1 Tax=Streptomyces subrutilus TaxID=36818 RepID=UPI001676FE8F|nr:hypothetical protein [Streptomyces subrutilus]